MPSTPTHSACATCSHPSLLRESLAGVWFQVRKPCWVEMHTFRSTAVASAAAGTQTGPTRWYENILLLLLPLCLVLRAGLAGPPACRLTAE